MLLHFLKKSLLYIVIIVLCLVSQHGMAVSLNDLEASSENKGKKQEFQLATLHSSQKKRLSHIKEVIQYPQLFGSSETKSNNISIFPKWTNVLARYQGQKKLMEKTCKGKICPLRAWQNFLTSIQNKPMKQKVSLVNRYINRVNYITDSQNWQTSDYWQTPAEFFERNGDCEDYAITKYISLRMLGVPESAMRIVVVKDQHLRAIHAILVVYMDGQAYLLDNQIKQMVNSNLVRHYQPIYSINETAWWHHKAS